MFPGKRSSIRIGAFIVVALALSATVQSDPVARHKTDLVRAVLEEQGRISGSAALFNAAGRAAGLLDLHVDLDGHLTRVVFHTSGQPLCDVLLLDNGRCLVVDFYHTVTFLPNRKLVPEHRVMVRQIRTSQEAFEPMFVSRVELDLAAPCEPVLSQHEGRIELALRPLDDVSSFEHTLAETSQLVVRRQRRIAIERCRLVEQNARALGVLTTPLRDAMDKLVGEAQAATAAQHRTLAGILLDADSGDLDEDAARARLHDLQTTLRAAIETDKRHFDEIALRAASNVQDALVADHFVVAAGPEAPRGILDEVAALVRAQDAQQCSAVVLPQESLHSDAEWGAYEDLEFQTVDVAQIDLAFSNLRPLAATADSPEPAASEAEESAPELLEPLTPEVEPEVRVIEAEETAPSAEKKAPPATVSMTTAAIPGSRPEPEYIPGMDPLYQSVSIDFRDMELSNVVALLAQKAQINVIAGPEVTLTAPVTAYLQNVPLLTAMETVLRMSDLGVVEEEGIFRILPYDQALRARRTSTMVYLKNGQAAEVESTLTTVAASMLDEKAASVAANATTNVIIISGDEESVAELEQLAYQLDVAEPTLATVTEAIKLNYAEPIDVMPLVESMLTPEGVGTVEGDTRSRHLIVTDMPVVIEEVRELIKQVDMPVKQVAIEAMIVDAVLRDESHTGVTWLLDLVRERDATGQAVNILDGSRNTRGNVIGSLQDLNMGATLGNIGTDTLDAGVLTFGILSDELDFRGAIAAEAASSNAEILANPVVVTVENKEAQITIVQDFPYQEITQSTQGPPVSSTAFKEIGINLTVTPRVTHENDIIVELEAKQSSISGLTQDGIPIEDKRIASTTLLTNDGRTIFLGGLRDISDRMDVSKIPLLGDIPVLNFMFRNTDVDKIHTELLIFLTCHVVQDQLPELTAREQVENDKIDDVPQIPDAQRALFRSLVKPGEMRDPAWKWRRTP